jgi:Flagellar hook-length control protein FliK
MSIPIGQIIPVIAAQGVASGVVLQPGTVVSAQVLQVLSNDLVRIAIANLSIDVQTEVPLQAGQNLQLAVSQTADNIRLAVVGQGTTTNAPNDAISQPSQPSPAPDAPLTAAASSGVLTAPERSAVSAATQTAVTQQGSLSQLFANLGAVAASGSLPPALQQAVTQLLAQRTSLDGSLTGSDVQNAFQKSGLFLEASLASGSVSSSGVPDLKAALIVLRQTLLSSVGTTGPVESTAISADAVSHGAAATLAPSLSADAELQEILLPQPRLPAVAVALETTAAGRTTPPAISLEAALNLLQEAQEIPADAASASGASAAGAQTGDAAAHTNTPPPPPPPFRGSLPSAQPVASALIAPNAPLSASAHHLLHDTDAAIARQTLLQVASLPDRVDNSGSRLDPTTPRWSFEVPFVTPQGTAVAQFEISRDGGGNETEAAKRVWRARFSLDVEPAGPVHALVSLSGERTSVRMWAERPATADQLRASVSQLNQALSRAELVPGDIVIRDGAPTPAAAVLAGHFLDRAL